MAFTKVKRMANRRGPKISEQPTLQRINGGRVRLRFPFKSLYRLKDLRESERIDVQIGTGEHKGMIRIKPATTRSESYRFTTGPEMKHFAITLPKTQQYAHVDAPKGIYEMEIVSRSGGLTVRLPEVITSQL